MNRYHKKPYGKASGYKKLGEWHWQCVSWVKCHCGLWHSNRFIPPEFWEQEWIRPTVMNRKKVGIILIKDKRYLWVTQSYHKCYGFPKGEKEPNESIEDCAKREFKEETGCSIDKVKLSDCVVIRTGIEDIQYIFYCIHVDSNFDLFTFPVDDVEITSCGWVDIDSVGNLKLSKAIRRVFELFKKNIWIINKN